MDFFTQLTAQFSQLPWEYQLLSALLTLGIVGGGLVLAILRGFDTKASTGWQKSDNKVENPPINRAEDYLPELACTIPSFLRKQAD